MPRITRYIAEAAVCATVGSAFALGCVYAATPWNGVPNTARSEQSPAVTFGSPLSQEEIDVLAEGDDWDHPWESCRINSDLWVFCPDGARVEYPAPLDDGSVTVAHAFDDQQDLPTCRHGEHAKQPDLPCRVDVAPTYVEGGDGTRHDGCYVTLLSVEDSEMVCTDDTVWAS